MDGEPVLPRGLFPSHNALSDCAFMALNLVHKEYSHGHSESGHSDPLGEQAALLSEAAPLFGQNDIHCVEWAEREDRG